MRDKVLNALMQLFAIIVGPRYDNRKGRSIVESFLYQQTNDGAVPLYLELFAGFYAHYQKKLNNSDSNKEKNLSLNSVKVIKICTQINGELNIRQKTIVLVKILEFINVGDEVMDQELEFARLVADIFMFTEESFYSIKDYVFSKNELPVSPQLLVINGQKATSQPDIRHCYHEGLEAELWVYYFKPSNMYLIRKFGEEDVLINGQNLPEGSVFVISHGASLRNSRIKPIYYSDIVNLYMSSESGKRIQFVAKDVEYEFKGGVKGLNPINICENSGTLIGIMGSSGSGKTTLLNVLNGNSAPSKGSVTINGIDIFAEKEKIEGIVGYVSQDDLLIEELTVFQNLYFSAKLCFNNVSENQLRGMVSRVLKSVGLFEIRDLVVGSPLNKKISGGQRKRLNIALELIREPAVLFLDEPTSGLSSRDSENIMDLLKELTLKGKLVFVVIHQPSSVIFKMFDKLYILDRGGYLIYNGNPVESIVYFKNKVSQSSWNDSECPVCGNVNPEQIFNIVESQVLDEYGNVTSSRRKDPEIWYSYYLDSQKELPPVEVMKMPLPETTQNKPGPIKQFSVFVMRDVLTKISNKQYLFINILEAPILAFLLSFLIRYFVDNGTEKYYLFNNPNLPVYIFMSVIVAIFIGLSVSAEEIIKDQKILKREKFLNLSRDSYIFSKLAILLSISAVQAFLFVAIGNTILGIGGMLFHYWFALFSAWFFASVMGLIISDSFDTVVTIYILIPFLVIPQLIFSGIIVPFDKLNPSISSPNKIPWYGEIIAARWVYEGLAVYQFRENEYERDFFEFDKALSQCDYMKNYWLKTLDNKVAYCHRNYNDPHCQVKVNREMELIRNEMTDIADLANYFGFSSLDKLYPALLNEFVFEDLTDVLSKIKSFYTKQYNHINSQRDIAISSKQQTPYEREMFLQLKRNCANENLEAFVRNSTSFVRIVEQNGHLYQKCDPIFMDSKHPFIKAHFYAPAKNMFGMPLSTYWVNMFVLWCFTLVQFFALKFRLLRKLIDAIPSKGIMK